MPLRKKVFPGTGMPGSKRHTSDPDRISALPDDLMNHVMFFLTLQEAVQTCVLSQKWQDVWKSMMWFDADAAQFSSMKSFKKFVDNFLLYRSCVPLDVFFVSVTCDKSSDSLDYSDIHPWVHDALRSNAWALGIRKHCGAKLLSIDGYPFPFTSVHLKLLHLCHFSVDDSFVKNLSSGCPLLEDLELENCAISVTMFSSATLKSLIITSANSPLDDPEGFEHHHLLINMPNLESLRLEEIPKRNIHLLDVSSVEKASIYFFSLSFKNSDINCNILSALSNATNLVLMSPSVYEDVVPKVLLRDLPRCKTFSNLTTLALGEWFLRDGCYPLLYLLRCSPNIEKVILQLDEFGAYDYEKFPNAAAQIDPPCQETEKKFNCEKLSEIKIYFTQGDKRVGIITRVLLANISPLPEIKIKLILA